MGYKEGALARNVSSQSFSFGSMWAWNYCEMNLQDNEGKLHSRDTQWKEVGRSSGWASNLGAPFEHPDPPVPETHLPLGFPIMCGSTFPFLFNPVCVGLVSLPTRWVLMNSTVECFSNNRP